MGLRKEYNEISQKWELKGFGFFREYDTEEEMNNDYVNAYDEYAKSLKIYRTVANSLCYAHKNN